jgi:hypothetical protein
MVDRLVSPERTHWRDQALSERHRQWGFDAPAVDIDFLMIEYDREKPCALVEYKAYQGRAINLESSGVRTVNTLAEMCKLPFFVVAYHPSNFGSFVKPMNAWAVKWLKERAVMTEAQYVTFLYRLRGAVVPEKILRLCNRTWPIGGR